MESKIVLVVGLLMVTTLGEAIKCYHCYDSYDKPKHHGNSSLYGSTFVRCEKNINNWNTWECPPKWPVCVIMTGKVKDHYETIRTCAIKDFCSGYQPPAGVRLDACQECNTTLCNNYLKLPEPPVNPGPLFHFNININLNIKKYPLVSSQDGQ